MEPMRVGHSVRDITPATAVTLSGFAARRNQLCESVDDPLEVQVLSLDFSDQLVLLVVFDLLGLGPELTSRIRKELHGLPEVSSKQAQVVLCATHTHSAPATIRLIGCGIEEPSYWNHVVEATTAAVTESLRSRRTAVLRYTLAPIQGVSYNRRRIVSDGRVLMSFRPKQRIVEEGPVWDRLLMVRFEDPGGQSIGGIISWAAHPCVVCSLSVSADYPGELRRIATKTFGGPFLFLQGPSANINLPFKEMSREEMLQNVRRLAHRIESLQWSNPLESFQEGFINQTLRLEYGPLPTGEELSQFDEGMKAVAQTGSGPERTMRTLANILNIEPESPVDRSMLQHIASALREWSTDWLHNFDQMPSGNDIELGVLRLGPLWFCFAAAELFSETGFELQSRHPDQIIIPVAYASPLVGYLPTDEALEQGGYEVEHAYRFYGHAAPFAAGSERRVCDCFDAMIRQLKEVES